MTRRPISSLLVVSEFIKESVYEFPYKKPAYALYHLLSGKKIRVSAATLEWFRILKDKKHFSLRHLKSTTEPSSWGVIDLFLDERIFLNEGLDELERLLKMYPHYCSNLSFQSPGENRKFIFSDPVDWKGEPLIFCPSKLIGDLIIQSTGYTNLNQIIADLSRGHSIPKRAVWNEVRKYFLSTLNSPGEMMIHFMEKPFRSPQEEASCPGFSSTLNYRSPEEHFSNFRKSIDGPDVNLTQFHKEGIVEAFHEFDDVETTVAHALREPNAILNHKSYGMQFCSQLVRHSFLKPGFRVLEVGGGTGIFAKELIKEYLTTFPQPASKLSYSILDLSPVLQKNQKKVLAQYLHSKAVQVQFILDDGQKMDRAPDKLDLIISNEVIADFKSVKINKIMSEDLDRTLKKVKGLTGSQRLAYRKIKKYQIPVGDAPREFFFNIGAILFLENIWKKLKPGGAAVISEFGDNFHYPEPTSHLNHPEYSIHFGHLYQVAHKIGFEKINIIDLNTFIPFNPHCSVFSGELDHLVFAVKKLTGAMIKKKLYSRDELEALLKPLKGQKIRGITYKSFHEGQGWGPNPMEFKVLYFKKPL